MGAAPRLIELWHGAAAVVYLYYLAIGRKRIIAARVIPVEEQRRAA